MKRVILESPYAGDVDANLRYARACMRDCLERGEAPIASHLLYTQPGILDDHTPAERQWGILAGLAWRPAAELSVFYTDRGWSSGMLSALKSATEGGWPFELRSLAGQPEAAPRVAGFEAQADQPRQEPPV
jgi:hypothetical protein